jgi:hypothetical protein
MSVVGEVRDALKLAGEVIDNTRTIVTAVNDGQAFLNKYHADAKSDLKALLEQVRKTMQGLVQVSRIVTHFQFTVAGSALDTEPRRFNNYVLAAKGELHELRDRIDDLRGSCKRIAEHRDALNQRTSEPWWGWVSLLGEKKEQRRRELNSKLEDVYFADANIIFYVERLMRAVEITLEKVSEGLRTGAGARPENVPAAAALLDEYAAQFRPVEQDCTDLVGELRAEIDDLR